MKECSPEQIKVLIDNTIKAIKNGEADYFLYQEDNYHSLQANSWLSDRVISENICPLTGQKSTKKVIRMEFKNESKKRKTSFKPGERKCGRAKGTPNKKTLLLESFAESVIDGGMTKFQEELNKLNGKEFLQVYLDLFEYVKPKLARTELSGKNDQPIVITVKTGNKSEQEHK